MDPKSPRYSKPGGRRKIKELLANIPIVDGEADSVAMEQVVVAADLLEDPRSILPDIFEWFEKHSGADLGSPGPFVHFIEQGSDYVELLATSISRKPTNLTVWMVSRLANLATNREELRHFVELLELARTHPLATPDVVQSVDGFLTRQRTRFVKPHSNFGLPLAGAFLALFAFLLWAERLTVFLPSTTTLQVTNALYVAYFLSLLILFGAAIAKGMLKDIGTEDRVFQVAMCASVVLAPFLFSLAFGQCTYNLIALTNTVGRNDTEVLGLIVVDKKTAGPEQCSPRPRTLHVKLRGDPEGTIRPVRYKCSSIDFYDLKAGDVVHVLSRPGWAGYTLEQVVGLP